MTVANFILRLQVRAVFIASSAIANRITADTFVRSEGFRLPTRILKQVMRDILKQVVPNIIKQFMYSSLKQVMHNILRQVLHNNVKQVILNILKQFTLIL